MSMQHDPDLEDVLQDQELRHVADLLREARMTEPPLDDAFRSALRRQLMNQAWGMGGGGTPWWRKVFGPTGMVWATAAVGVILIGAVVVLTATNQPGPSDQVVISSSISNQSAVRLQQPIQVTFNQPMEHRSTEAAVQITPATTVAFSWHENTLSVTPTAGDLAPNTQYQVTIGPGARTASGQSLTAPKTITFVTQPPPAPSPSPSPTVKPTPPGALTGQHLLASKPEGITSVLWSPDSSTVYFVTGKGALESVPAVAPGSATVLVGDGVSSVAINPAGDQIAYIRKGNIEILALGPGTTTEVVPTSAAVVVGWTATGVEWAAADGVYIVGPGGQGKVAPLPASGAVTPTSFAPDGAHLAYTQDQALDVLDIGTGKSIVVGSAGAHFLGWSPDGTGVMYTGALAVVLADLGGRNTSSLPAGEPSWSTQDEVLLGSDVNLFVMRPDASGQTKLAEGTFHLPTWAPNGIAFTYFRGGELFTASAPAPAPPATSPLDAATSAVNNFMKARKDNPDKANAYLDDNGRKAYASSTGGLNLQVTGDPGFSRYYLLTGQITGSHPDTAQFVVRIVLAHNNLDVKTFEETLTLVRTQGSQQFLIDQAVAGPVLTLGSTAEVVSVDVTATSVKVTFDSDLKPETVTAGVIILDSKGKQIGNAPAYAKRTVTIDGLDLKAGKSYKLVVLSTVQDVSGNNIAVEYDLAFVGPADMHGDRHRDISPSPSPLPSPSATPSS